MHRFAAALALLALPGLALAQDDVCQADAGARMANRDGSTLALRTECPSADTRRYVVEFACADARPCDRLEVGQEVAETPMGHAALVDIDGDGMHEVEVRGMCGAGPNCEGDVYRIDPRTRKFIHFFSGGYAELQVLDGWLVEAGRSSCCAWEFHGWKLDTATPPLTYDNMDLLAQVDAGGDEAGNVTSVQCTFLRPNGDNRQVVAPPSPALERICEHYGEPYDLTPPDTTPGAP